LRLTRDRYDDEVDCLYRSRGLIDVAFACSGYLNKCIDLEEFMAFVSQLDTSKARSGRMGDSSLVVTQSFKESTKSQELSIRVSSVVLSRAGMAVGDFVDVLYDNESNRWMIKKVNVGLKITGKDKAPTGLIRYTLKIGHARFTDDREYLPIKKVSIEDSIDVEDGQIIFKLK